MKKNHFWTIHLDYSIIGIVFTLLMIGILSVYVAVSHDYPQMVWPFLGQQLAWIGVGCIICLIVTIFSTKFLWKITPFLYLLGLALMVLPLVFYNPNLVASTGAKKLGSLWKHHLISAFRIYEDSLHPDAVTFYCSIFTKK